MMSLAYLLMMKIIMNDGNDFQVPSHGISKISYISITLIPGWQLSGDDRIIYPRSKRRLTQRMRCDKIFGQANENIKERLCR